MQCMASVTAAANTACITTHFSRSSAVPMLHCKNTTFKELSACVKLAYSGLSHNAMDQLAAIGEKALDHSPIIKHLEDKTVSCMHTCVQIYSKVEHRQLIQCSCCMQHAAFYHLYYIIAGCSTQYIIMRRWMGVLQYHLWCIMHTLNVIITSKLSEDMVAFCDI